METSVTEDALDMRVKKAGHDKIPLARIERRSRSGSAEIQVRNDGRNSKVYLDVGVDLIGFL